VLCSHGNQFGIRGGRLMIWIVNGIRIKGDFFVNCRRMCQRLLYWFSGNDRIGIVG
jgi:hypothetical protein